MVVFCFVFCFLFFYASYSNTLQVVLLQGVLTRISRRVSHSLAKRKKCPICVCILNKACTLRALGGGVPTMYRRFLCVVLEDMRVLERCSLSALAAHSNSKLFRQLLDMFRFYLVSEGHSRLPLGGHRESLRVVVIPPVHGSCSCFSVIFCDYTSSSLCSIDVTVSA